MNFIKLGDHWYKWDMENMRAVNYHHGHFYIDENSEEFCNSVYRTDCDSWHELYQKTGYMPVQLYEPERDMWIAPSGFMYEGNAHELCAEWIWDIHFGEELPYYGDKLIEQGWIKVTTSLMYYHYVESGMYDKMYPGQAESFLKWVEKYGMNRGGN